MKKLFTKMAIGLIITSVASPLIACSFNFYVNRAANAIAHSFANQTSAVLKSLVMSKVLDSDSISTNDDIMNQNKNNSTINATKGQNVNNWGDFANKWGDNGTIDVNGFDPNAYFKATGSGSLTKSINTRQTINNTFNNASQIRLLTSLTNPALYNLAISNSGLIHGPIVNFLQTLQGDLKDKPALLKLIINLINKYGSEFIPTITRLMANLVNNDWDDKGSKTPAILKYLEKFIINWKDNNGQPYSQWINGDNWDLNSDLTKIIITVTQGHDLSNWSKEDFNLYRGGILINYLFWKISSDHPEIVNPVKKIHKPRYLGDVISDNIDGTKINQKVLTKDIKQFVPYLLTNPLYPLLIVESVIPIIKKWLLEMPDITLGVKHLTVGNIKTDQTTQSFNLLDIANTIKSVINNPEKLKAIIKKIIGWSNDDKTLDTFTYDLKIPVTFIKGDAPLGSILNSTFINKEDKDELVDQVVNLLTADSTKPIIDNIFNVIQQLAHQYYGNEYLDIDLIKTQLFLLDARNGLLIKITSAMLNLKDIIKNNDPIQDNTIAQLYISLGGNIPGTNFNVFTSNEPIDIIQKAMIDQNSPLSQILNLIFGTTTDDKKSGIANMIIKINNQWIKSNYEDYFDINNNKLGHVYNITMHQSTTNNIETINLKYDFNYTIKNSAYHFTVTLLDHEDLSSFQGMHSFKFKTITLININ